MFGNFFINFAAKSRRSAVAAEAGARGIQYLVHFTRIENLVSILNHGLMTRKSLDEKKLSYCFNDSERLDNLPDTISLSVTSPNYKMFWKYRQSDKSAKWIIIRLHAYQVLSSLECAFNFTNAANHEVRDTPIADRKEISAFQKIFYDSEDDIRQKCELKNNEPTDPQAEVLCFNSIQLNFFEGIVFFNQEQYSPMASLFDNLKECDIKLYPNGDCYFAPRHDWRYW